MSVSAVTRTDVDGGDRRYQLRSFRPVAGDGGTDDDTAAWLTAAALTFLQPTPTAGQMAKVAASFAAERRILTGVYAADSPPGAWDARRPVATYGSFVKSMNVGGPSSLDVHLIADVTVRATHRRRGLLRAMITSDLRRAAADGVAVAALRAAEATIYERFGFGPAVFNRHVQVDTGGRFALRRPPTGQVEVADPAVLLDVAPAVFERYHAATPGSITRQAFYPRKVAGIWAEDRPQPDPSVRVALHYGPGDTVDGYVSYRPGPAGTIEVIDLVSADIDAYLSLWAHLAAVDHVSVVDNRQAPVDDALPWALTDRRGYRVVGEEDAIWLRILDPVAALRARNYHADGELSIALSDPLGIADGVVRLAVRDGTGTAARTGAPADVTMDVSTFGSLYLGGVPAPVLAAAGRITGSAAALAELDALLARPDAAHCLTQF